MSSYHLALALQRIAVIGFKGFDCHIQPRLISLQLRHIELNNLGIIKIDDVVEGVTDRLGIVLAVPDSSILEPQLDGHPDWAYYWITLKDISSCLSNPALVVLVLGWDESSSLTEVQVV